MLATIMTSLSLIVKMAILISLQSPVQAGPAAGNDIHTHWSYESHQGPSHWCTIDPHSQCCGQHQSPIDIDEFEAQLELFRPLVFINYTHVPDLMSLKNNGHTVVVSFGKTDYVPGFTGGGLKDYFLFESLHFHWGKDNNWGSEHTLGGRRYPLEMHLVHYNSKYGILDKAKVNPDGLAVISILFHLAEKDNPKLQGIIKGLNDVRYNNDSIELSEPFPLSDILPPRTDDFFRYEGSLTTPPCSEVVTWTVLDSTVAISDYQMSRFRTIRRTKLEDHQDTDLLVDNFRPTQSLHGRRVHARSTLAKIRALTHSSASNSKPLGLTSCFTTTFWILLYRKWMSRF